MADCGTGADQVEPDHRRSRLKIRRAPSSAALASCPSSFHRCLRQSVMIKKGCTTATRAVQIIHTSDPKVIVIEPAEFMSWVQLQTGSPATRKLMRETVRKQKSAHLVRSTSDHGESAVLQDPLKEGRTIFLAPAAEISCSANANCTHSTADSAAASPACLNRSGLPRSFSHEPESPAAVDQAHSYRANPFAAPFTKQLEASANHPPDHPPLSSISANSATYEENNYSADTSSPTSSNSPLSANSSLSTVSTEGLGSMEGGGASCSSREGLRCLVEEGSIVSAEEDGGIGFFNFSVNSFYGAPFYTAPQDELDQRVNFSNVLAPFESL